MGTSPHGPSPRTRRAALLAVGCAVVSVGTLLATTALEAEDAAALPATGGTAWWVTVVALLAQAGALARARLRPRTVLVATGVAAPLAALAGARDATSLTTLAVVLAVYVAVTTRPLRTLVPALAVTAVLVAAGGALAGRDSGLAVGSAIGLAVVQTVGTLALVLVVASWVAAVRESRRAREDERRAVAREQSALVRAAVDRERTAMARELHDIAAHHLSGIAVMASALERQVLTDPDGAQEAARQVRQQSRSVLRDLRSLVGLLREGDPASDARPETLAGVRALVADVAATGREVALAVLGDEQAAAREVGPLAQLAAYRAVQEALANAARHAPGAACSVTVDARDDRVVEVVVRNGPADGAAAGSAGSPGAAGGFGLVGMRERAALTGADLDVGPTDDGGWQVRLRLPREGEVA
ncbi:sensor histidine kinase [Nocardioides sp. Arc9.136]|uniref:sensor histidine kinase n=1 Tax=Nocardioides sp. Arc9.136 TaxID=2996826 RepID=UPI002667076C|nr:histidine kinase [Nocardioides sp. Arc9.136]WKN48972.1 histidine kinase [Nocardioides sp. Arc9.136]